MCDCKHGLLCHTASVMKTQRDEALRRYHADPDDHNLKNYQGYDAAFQRHIAKAKQKETRP